jgi:putative endonuclease
MPCFVYIVECVDKTYYCGYTTDLAHRVAEHNAGKTAAKYTRARRPVKLLYSEEFPTKSQALRREIQIKKLTRKEKEKLIRK